MEQNNKKQETEYLYWSNGIFLGIMGSILGSLCVSSFFIMYQDFNYSWKFILTLEFIIFIISLFSLICLYLKFKTKTNKISNNLIQEKLDRELEKGRLKSAMSILKKDPSLNLNISKAIDVILRKKEDPLVFLKQYKEIKEISPTDEARVSEDLLGSNSSNVDTVDLVIIDRFLNNNFAKPLDVKLWKDISERSKNFGSCFNGEIDTSTISWLTYCLIFNVTKHPLLYFDDSPCDSNRKKLIYSDSNDYKEFKNLIKLLNENPYIRQDVKEILKEIDIVNN